MPKRCLHDSLPPSINPEMAYPPYCNLACLSLQFIIKNLLSCGICLTLRINVFVFLFAVGYFLYYYIISLAWMAFVRS